MRAVQVVLDEKKWSVEMKKKNSFANVVLSVLLVAVIAIAPMPVGAGVIVENLPYDVDYIDIGDLEIVNDFGLLEQIDLRMLECEYFAAEFMEAVSIMNLQARAVEAYGLLMEYFLTYVDGYLELIHPDTYAGAYVEGDMLVIRLTDISGETTVFYKNILGDLADAVMFEQVSFSKNQLRAFGEIFVDAVDAPVVEFGVDTMANAFSITLDESYAYSMQVVESFNANARFMPVPIMFELGEAHTFASTLFGGSAIASPGAGSFSVGATGYHLVSGMRQGYALLTTGHAFRGRPNNATVTSNGVPIGTLSTFRFGHYSAGIPGTVNGDWAIVSLNAEGARRVTDFLRDGRRISGAVMSPPVNTLVGGLGFRTLTSGHVMYVNRDVVIQERCPTTNIILNEITMSGMTRARTSGTLPQGGDSGGTVFTLAPQNHVMLAGVIATVRVSDGTWTFSPFQWKSARFIGLW